MIYKNRYVQQYNTSLSCSEACGNVTRPEGHGVWWGLCRCCQRGPAAPWLLRRHPRTVAMVVARATAHEVVLVSMVLCEVVWCWWGWLPSWSGLGGAPRWAPAPVWRSARIDVSPGERAFLSRVTPRFLTVAAPAPATGPPRGEAGARRFDCRCRAPPYFSGLRLQEQWQQPQQDEQRGGCQPQQHHLQDENRSTPPQKETRQRDPRLMQRLDGGIKPCDDGSRE